MPEFIFSLAYGGSLFFAGIVLKVVLARASSHSEHHAESVEMQTKEGVN